MSSELESPYAPPSAPLREPDALELGRRAPLSIGGLRAVYGVCGGLASLPFAFLGASVISEAHPFPAGALFWLFATVAATLLPAAVLHRVPHPVARLALAGVLVGMVAALTGLWGSLVAMGLSGTGSSWGVLALSLLMAVYVAPIGIPIQVTVELAVWIWRRWRAPAASTPAR